MAQENLPLPVPDGNNNIVDNITGLIGAVNGVLGQVNVTDNFTLTNSILDTVQNIKTTSAPRFAGLRIGALSGVSYLTNGTMSALTVGSALSVINSTLNVNAGSNLTINGQLNTIQDIQTDSSPVFAGVTVENFTLGTGPNAQSGLLAAINGVVAPVSLAGTSLTFSTQFNVLNTIQDIRTTAYPSFRGLTIGNTSGLALLTAGVVSSVALGTGLSITNGILNAEAGPNFYPVPNGNLTVNELGQGDTIQNIKITSSPTFAGLTLTGKNGILYGNAGVVSTVTVNDNLIFSSGALNTVQNIKTTSTPTFAGLTLSGFTGVLISTSGTISTVSLGSGLKNTAGILDTIQPIDTSATPAFSGLTLGTGPGEFNGILGAINGTVTPVTLGTSLTFNTQYNILSTVQDIRTTATVTFHTVNLTTLNIGSATGILYTNTGSVGYVSINPNLTLSSGILDTVQGIQTTSTPAFAGLTLGAGVGAFNGILSAINGVVQPATLGTSLTFNSNTLTTVQDIRTTATPTFASLILSGLTLGGSSGVLLANGGAVYVETLGANLSIASGSLNLAPNISVTGLTVGSGSGFAWLTAGVVSAALLSGNLRNTAGTVDLADQIAVGGLTVGALGGVLTGTAGIVGTATIGARLTYAGGILNAAADQSFATLTLGTLTGLLQGTAGVVSAVTLDPNLTLVSSVLAIKATPSFTGLKLNLIDGVMLMQSGSVSLATLSGNLILTGSTLSVTTSPNFTGLTLGNLSGLLYAVAGVVGQILLDTNLTLTGSSLAINTTPTFEGLTLGTGPGAFNGILGAVSGVIGTITRGLSLTFNSNTLDTVQDIRTTATVTFHTVNLSALNFGISSGMLITNGGAVGYSLFGSNLSFSANTLSISSSPSFSGLTIGTLSGLLYGSAGVVGSVILGSNLFLTSGTLSISSSPSFSGLTIGTLSGLLYGSAGVVGQSLLGSNLSFTSGTLSISSTPNFSGATIGTTTALIYRNAGLLSDIILDSSLTLTGSTLAVNPSANFTNITLGTLTGVIYATAGVVSALSLGTNLTITSNILNVKDPPVFSGLTLGTGIDAFAGILGAIAGQVSPVNLSGTSLTFSTQYNILNTVQDIRTTASPTFATLTLSSLTASTLLYLNGTKQISSASTSANLTLVNGFMDTVQGIQTTSSPAFSGLTLGIGPGLFNGILGAAAGIVGVIDRGPSITFSLNTLDTIQDIRSTASPTFSSLTLSDLTASRLLYLSAVKQITSASVSANLGFASGILDTVQDIQTSSSPTFTGLTLSGLTASRLLYTNATKQLTSASVSANLGFVNGSLDTVQDIQTSSSPTFTGLTLSGLTASRLLYTNATKQLTSAAVSANLGFASGILDTVQGIQTSSSPTFAGLTLGVGIDALDGILGAVAGVVGTITRGLSLTFNLNTLDTIQDIRSTASPTFSTLTLSGLTASRLLYVNAVKLTASATTSANLTFTSGLLDTIQDIQTTSTPQFSGLTLGLGPTLFNGILGAIAGVVNPVIQGLSITYSLNTLDTIQDIRTTASPTFSTLTLSGLTASRLIYVNAVKQITSAVVTANLTFTGGTLDTIQGIQTTSAPTFAAVLNSSWASTNVICGTSTFNNTATGTGNVLVGNAVATAATSMINNVMIGNSCEPLTTTASNCVLVGSYAKLANVTDSNSIAIGFGANGQGSNTAVYGNAGITNHYFTSGIVNMAGLTLNNIAPNNGILYATAGVVSALTLANLATALSGSSPSFNVLTTQSLTLRNVYNGLLKATAGVISQATAGIDYQAPMTGSGNLIVSGNTIFINSSPTFNVLTVAALVLSNVASGMLKSSAGSVVQAAPNIDYQPPIIAGSNLTLYGATLAVLSTPTFTGINCTTLGTQNTICGTSAGITLQTSSTDNALFGYQAGQSITSGSQNVAVGSQAMGNTGVMTGNGQNVAVGYQSLYSLSGATLGNIAIGGLAGRLITTSVYNVSIGASANQALVTGNGNNVAIGASSGFITENSTGSYGTYIGANANPSGAAVIGELVMSNTAATVTGKGANTAYLNYSGGLYVTGNIIPNCNTTSNCYIGNAIASSAGNVTNEGVINVASSTATGRGANTMFINAPAGLYSYNPAYCMLYSTAFNNGNVTWAFWNDGTTTYNQGFTLYNSNTLVVQPFNGLYEINFSGSAVCSGNSYNINLNVNNIKVFDVSLGSSGSINGYAVSINGSTFSRPYALAGGTSTGWSVAMQNCYYWRSQNPLFMMIKFIGL
jgi:hypothetical protein